MMWLLLAVVGIVLVVRVVRRRHTLFTMSRSESISTVHLEMSKRHTARTKAALDAASASLR